MPENNIEAIKNARKKIMILYTKQGYFSVYGPNVIYFIFIIILLFLVISFTYVMSIRKTLRANWNDNKCKPYVIPFAGVINLPEGDSFLNFTSTNFQYCIQNIISSFSQEQVDPLNFITSFISDLVSMIADIIQDIQGMFNYLRSQLMTIIGDIYSRALNIIIPAIQMIIKASDILGKTQATMSATLFTFLGTMYTFVGFLDAFIQVVFTTVVALIVLIVFLIIMSVFAPGWALPVLTVSILSYTAITVPLALIVAFVIEVFGTPNFSGEFSSLSIKKCFDKNTLLTLYDGTNVKISEINNGDRLRDGSIVQSCIIVERGNDDMYDLNGVIVSGTHNIFHKNKWILVSEYPNIQKISNYDSPFLYCLNTSSKMIYINNISFSDWDDIIADDKYLRLMRNASIEKTRLDLIHRFYNKGFPSNTQITLSNGNTKYITDIEIGDELRNNNKLNDPIRVYGKVTIYSNNLLYGNLLDNTMKDTKHLGNLFHLLTREEYFYVDGKKYFDYNSCVDLYVV
jgi:hypothetical protein